jgi:integrase/recombinase XerD
MKRTSRKRLQIQDWPEQDRRLWNAAFKLGDVFEDTHGCGAHLAERTRQGLLYQYECFLGFLRAQYPALLARPSAERLDTSIIRAYVECRSATCTQRTIAGELRTLRLALELLSPTKDWSELLAITKRIEAKAPRAPQRHHLVSSEQLYAVGIALMDRAAAGASELATPARAHAFEYRDGLIIILLALIPLRRRTVTALRIGSHLVRSGNHWVLDIPRKDMKTSRAIDFSLGPELSARLDIYLSTFRCRIPGAETHDGLWASNKNRCMDGGAIYDTVRRRTREALGFPVNLHRFRHAAGILWSVHDPANVRGVKDLLGHVSFGTTDAYYIPTRSRLAGRALARVLDRYRRAAR